MAVHRVGLREGARFRRAALHPCCLHPLGSSSPNHSHHQPPPDRHHHRRLRTMNTLPACNLQSGCPRVQVVNLGPRDMRMFYTSWDVSRRRFVACMATSPDGFKWTKKGVVFDPAGLSAAAAAASSDEDPGASSAFDALGPASVSVVRDVDNRQLLMFYEAVGCDNRRSIGMAVSKDGGAVWRRYGAPVLEAADGGAAAAAWDGGDVGHPCAVSMSAGRWRLYYTGRQTSGSGKTGRGFEEWVCG